MKHFVVFSDLHLHQWQYGSRLINGRNSRLEQQKEVVKSIVRYCTEKDISQCVFTGDLFHTSTVAAETGQAAYEAFKGFKENGIDLTILVGNHDQSNRTGGSHALSWLGHHGRLVDSNVGENGSQTVGGINAHFFPFTADADILRGWISGIKGRSLCFFHQGVGGVELNSKGFTLNEILTGDLIPVDCAMAFSGHYHSFKPVTSNLIIPGSTTQLNWSDAGEPRGWLDVTVDGEQVTEINLIQSKASTFIRLHEEDFDAEAMQTALQGITSNFVQVLTSGAYKAEDICDTVLRKYGALSCEIKPIHKEVSPFKTTATVASLNEVIYSFARAKEKEGVINEHDAQVGESLLKKAYRLPQV
jgi:DNA repair exonuclease SbcCD nuclease subunit